MAMAGIVARNDTIGKRGVPHVCPGTFPAHVFCNLLNTTKFPAHFPHTFVATFCTQQVSPHNSRTRVLQPFEHNKIPRTSPAHVFGDLLNTANLPRKFPAHVFPHFGKLQFSPSHVSVPPTSPPHRGGSRSQPIRGGIPGSDTVHTSIFEETCTGQINIQGMRPSSRSLDSGGGRTEQ